MSGDPWRVLWSSSGRRSLRNVPPKLLPAVLTFAAGPLAENPMRTTKPLGPPLAEYRSARVGVYRLLVRLEGRDVVIIKVDHRAHIYQTR